MKRSYIIPSTSCFAFRTDLICQTGVTSLQGNFDVNLGGGADPGSTIPIDPM